jgi:hypothetical protein
MAPTLRVVAPAQTLCVWCWVTQSVMGGIPTRSVGTLIALARHMMFGFWPQADVDGSHAPRGSTCPDALRLLLGDAERHGRHAHAERGNDHYS